MPETKPKTRCSPSNGLDLVDEADVIAAANRLVSRSRNRTTSRHRTPNHRQHHQHHQRPSQGRRDATGLTANQETKLKAGDLRMARMQISLSQLRTEMEASSKQLRDLAKVVHVDVDAD
ncbi:hypothetical protein KR018_007976 [Drosophila ironensis]|nr:hypothetical protein KR018_007976 [Drosophila ironensis]